MTSKLEYKDSVPFGNTPVQFVGVIYQTIVNMLTGSVTSVGYIPIGIFAMIQSEYLKQWVTTLIKSILDLVLNVVVALTTEITGLITGVLSILRLVSAIVKFINDAGDLVIDWTLKISHLLLQFLIDLT